MEALSNIDTKWWAIIIPAAVALLVAAIATVRWLIDFIWKVRKESKVSRDEETNKELRALLDKALDKIPSALDPKNPPPVPQQFEDLEEKVNQHIKEGGYLNADDLLRIGNVEFSRSKYNRAMHYYRVALDQANQRYNKEMVENSFGNISLIFSAMDEMAVTITHELRNPLSGIASFASLLERELDSSDPKRRLTAKIIRELDRVNEVVTTLLNYTHFEELNKVPVDYESFLKKTIDQFQQQAIERKSKVTIELCPADGPFHQPIILAIDRLLYRQVLLNVLSNSLEALAGKGKIVIRFQRLPRQRAVAECAERLLLGHDETVVETTISDTGPGISPEHLDRILAPFFSTKREGSGMGMAVAWKIMKAHGGDIVAENSPEGGAVFRLVLPTKMGAANEESLAGHNL
jgi:signal transduction histidine kinase